MDSYAILFLCLIGTAYKTRIKGIGAFCHYGEVRHQADRLFGIMRRTEPLANYLLTSRLETEKYVLLVKMGSS